MIEYRGQWVLTPACPKLPAQHQRPANLRTVPPQMMHYKHLLAPFLTIAALSLTSCGPSPAQTSQLAASPPLLAAKSATPAPAIAKPTSAKTVTVNAYKLDSRCTQQIAEAVTVPAQQPIQGAIAKVIEMGSNNDFRLAGFRVNVKSGTATVDLRVPPGAKRQIQSLSTCERMALLGSIRKTLISNRQWKIKTVKFTDRGKGLVL